MATGRIIEPNLDFIKEIKQNGGSGLKKCYQCATCSAVCELSPDDKPFPRKEMLMAGWGQADALAKDPDIWLCFQCNDCSTYCPRGAKPGDVLAAIRSHIYSKFSVPSFMGKALANPKALPILILLPVLILLGCIFAFAPVSETGEFLFLTAQPIDFDLFLPHSSVDALFVIGNMLIFLLAGVGFWRFWKLLNTGGEQRKMPFFSALYQTVIEIISHRKFFECGENKSRSWGHIILLAGFVGAMITTGCVFIFVFIPHYLHLLGLESLHSFFEVPINLPHPVKFIGMFSGIGLIVGGAMLIYRRLVNRDGVGANGYTDYLFLYIIFFVGLTGMLSWLTRLTGVPMLAYTNYFIHMIFVFFLLWYMPYSKFAHMIYRTMALIHARQIGRE